MPKVRNASGQTLAVHLGLPGERLLQPDEVFDVPEQFVYSYTLQDIWKADDADAEKAHTAGKKAEEAALYAERKRRGELTVEEIQKEADAEKRATAKAEKGDA